MATFFFNSVCTYHFFDNYSAFMLKKICVSFPCRNECITMQLSFRGCYGWVVSSSSSHIETLIPNVTIYEGRTLKEALTIGLDFLGGSVIICLQYRSHRRHRFNPWGGKIPWSKKWQPTPAFLENSMDRWAWWGYSPWDHKELDMTEVT